jgi:N-dimethylarginine dimethylaminohydrolase
MYNVYQHWDPLQVCLVGKTYPPEFYAWIENSATRSKFEKLAEETEEDYQNLIGLLEKFNVRVLRPEFPDDLNELYINGKWVQPPTAPRDYFIMIQDQFWIPEVPNASHAWSVFYRQNKQDWWPDFVRPIDFYNAYPEFQQEISEKFDKFKQMDQLHLDGKLNFYNHVYNEIISNGTKIVKTPLDFINGCFVSRIGNDLFFATQTYHDNKQEILDQVNRLFPNTRNHVVNAGGHGDAVYCPVTPGLIISLNDVPTYADTFPDWEVVYLPPSNYSHMRKFESSMRHNKGRWFVPGFEKDNNMINMVDHYFDEWVGQVSETVFDVNILIVDPKNIVVSTHNDQVESACARHGIEVHVSPFRHKYFWDCGIHCVTNDLHRNGHAQNFFNR